MSNNTIDAFFALVRAGLFGHTDSTEKTEKLLWGNVDWEKVYQLAVEQSVDGLIAAGIDRFKVQDTCFKCPQEWALQFIGSSLQLEQQNVAMNSFIAKLVDKMRNTGIYTLLVKGQGVAQCYERPLWRSCGDVDLLLSDDNYRKAKDFLIPLAAQSDLEEKHKKHLALTIEDWTVELHGSLRCGFSGKVDKVLDEIYRDTFYGGNVKSWDNKGVQVFLLGVENSVFYVFVHFLNHFYKGGVGLRQICDWCRLLWAYRDTLNLGILESRIREAGVMSEWKAFYTLATKYLGTPEVSGLMFQDSRKSKWEKKADKIMDFILMSGNMGHNRMSDDAGSKSYLMRKISSFGQRIGDLINHARIFPLDSIRFSFWIMLNGVRSAVRGE